MKKPRVLLVDDQRPMCEMLSAALRDADFEVKWTTMPDDALKLLANDDFDVIVSDIRMRGLSGLALCERIVDNYKDVPVILITGFGSMETAIAAIRAGAYDFLVKPVDTDLLLLAVRRALQHRSLRSEVTRLRRAVAGSENFEGLVGRSPAMRSTFELVDRVAASDVPVLIIGASGTGKELVARALHRRSTRREQPFVAVNCAAMPASLIESELFGHARGAFTDAKESRRGLFVEAHGGTLFLDELSELPLALQPKLLRALQERKVRPIGSSQEVDVDVRVVCATNRDLGEAIRARTFREDLYYRVNVLQVEVPPLSARGNDILLLAQHFIERAAARCARGVVGMTPEAAERLLAHGWPGNVRELQNYIERAVVLARYDMIAPDDLPEHLRTQTRDAALVVGTDAATFVPLEEVERRYILQVLTALGGNKSVAAQVLGVDRRTLYRKLLQWGVDSSGGDS